MSLPHRFPFRFVDAGADGRARIRLTANADRSRGSAAWGAAWLVEAIAQAAALSLTAPGAPGAELALAAIERAEVSSAPEPGATVDLSVQIERSWGRLVRVRGEARVDGRPAGSATLILSAG